MGRKSNTGMPPGIQQHGGYFWATLEGEHAKTWRDRFPGVTLPRRRVATLKDAVAAQRELIRDLELGRDPNADNPTVAAWVEQWIAGRQKIADTTRRSYVASFTYQIKPLKLGRLRLRQVNRDHVRGWVRELAKQPLQQNPDQTLDAYTVRNAFAVLRAALNGAVSDGLIPTNPCKGVELPTADHEEITPLTPADVAALLNLVDHYETDKATGATRPHRLAALYHVAIRCGLRQGEIIGLRKSDYDPKRRELRVAGQIQDGRRRKGKSKHAHRTLPVSADTARALAAHLQNLAEEERLSGGGWNAAGLLFVSENGTPLAHSNVWRTYTALLRRCGLTDPCEACKGTGRAGTADDAPACEACEGRGVIARFRFHDLRHTYAALSLAAGVDLFTLSRRMGHSSITVTADRYGHLYAGKDDDADALDTLLRRA
jgi:integrase